MDRDQTPRAARDFFSGLRAFSPRTDILAGLALWGMLVPEGLAYAGMAGMPVAAGLYTLLISLPVYFLLGGSPVLVCAATSCESIMMAAIVAPLAGGDPVRHAALTACLVILVGVIFLSSGLFKLGRITAFLSKPVMTGFTFGLAVFIAASQLHKILGLPRGHGGIPSQLFELATNLGQCNAATLAVGLGSLALLFACERFAPRLPASLMAMVLCIIFSHLFNLGPGHGVATVMGFPAGLPALALPDLAPAEAMALIPAALGLSLVAFSQAMGAETGYAEQFGHHIDANRELKALGAANIGSALAGGLLAGGSLSSTAVNVASGARSQASSLVTALMVALTLVFFTPVFNGLPEAVLGAVVLHAVTRLMKTAELRRYLSLNRAEGQLALVALFGVVLLDVLPGLAIAVAASLLRLIVFASKVHIAVLGAMPCDASTWVDVARHPGAREAENVRFLRLEGMLFFANAEKFHAEASALARQAKGIRMLGLHLKSNPRVCITSADMLAALARELGRSGIRLAFIAPAPDVEAILQQSGITSGPGGALVFSSFEQAVTGAGRAVV